jgi:methane/ammonia monooxygenase subunit B
MVKSKMLIVTTLAAVTVLSAMAAYMPVIPEADAHGVQAQLQSRFIRIEDESWSAQTLNTGDELTVTGTLQSLVNRPLRGWLSVFSESVNAGNRWEFISRDPPGNVFEIPPQGTIPYELSERSNREYIMYIPNLTSPM